MVDALAAQLGEPPAADEAGIDQSLAVDGIDELVRGFFTRGRSKLYDGTEYTVAVVPRDAQRRWVLRVAERLSVEAGDGSGDETDATLSGTAAELYLALVEPRRPHRGRRPGGSARPVAGDPTGQVELIVMPRPVR